MPKIPNLLKRLFLIDAIGASISTIILGLVFLKFHAFFGLPKNIFLLLAIIPFWFSIFSFTCYFKKVKQLKVKLKGIAFANLSYCLLTISLGIFYYESITIFGITYFLVETIIVTILSVYELKTAR